MWEPLPCNEHDNKIMLEEEEAYMCIESDSSSQGVSWTCEMCDAVNRMPYTSCCVCECERRLEPELDVLEEDGGVGAPDDESDASLWVDTTLHEDDVQLLRDAGLASRSERALSSFERPLGRAGRRL